MLNSILMVVHIVSATCIVALVLVQRGKGADAGAGFGAGASGTVFGARGATTALSRATAILAAVFMITSLVLAYMGTKTTGSAPDSLLDQLAEQETSTVPNVPVSPPANSSAPTPVPAPAPTPAN
jgi:preprotein translocase subunit SecG